MKALVARIGPEVEVGVQEVDTPRSGPGEALVRPLGVGLDGTDAEIVLGSHGEPAPGRHDLILGHEVVGVIEEIGPAVEGLSPGDVVTATVRRPDPKPCSNCRHGRPDLCLRTDYTERGIKGRDGFLAERFVEQVDYLVPLPRELIEHGFLVEPTSIVEKAVGAANAAQTARGRWHPQRAVVLGTGQIGLLSTAVLRLQDMAVWAVDRSPDDTREAQLVAMTGAEHVNSREEPLPDLVDRIGPVDMIMEGTGYAPYALDSMRVVGPAGVVVLLSVTGRRHAIEVDAAAVSQNLVLGNGLVLGSVSSSVEHFRAAPRRLAEIVDRWPDFLNRLVDQRIALDEAPAALRAGLPGLKTVVEFGRRSA